MRNWKKKIQFLIKLFNKKINWQVFLNKVRKDLTLKNRS